MLNAAIVGVVVLSGALLLWPRLAKAPLWRAIVTPLASIIGSGFLVLGPILNVSYGAAAPLVMLALCIVAYMFGSAIRFNIARLDVTSQRPRAVERLESLASAVLAFAYIISVAYYLNLFGAFGVSLTAFNDPQHARMLTTAVYLVILVTGWTKGFAALERMEQVSVGIKLAIIAGLLLGLTVHFGEVAAKGQLVRNPTTLSGWASISVMFGLIVTVQGFETSRYLGAAYDAPMRIRSMQLSQIISTSIYMLYIILLSYAFVPGILKLDETSIIDVMGVVAAILPVLLVAAALSAQFSAAIADTSGSGGLIEDVTKGAVAPKVAYLILAIAGIGLTWAANVFEIISYASRAFAAYYALQAAIAALTAWSIHDRRRAAFFAALTLLAAAMALFGQSVE